MEELTSRDPDDWLEPAGTTPRPTEFGPATLDLTGRAPASRRTTFATFVVTEADRLFPAAYRLTGDPERAEELLRSALATVGVNWSQRLTDPAHDVLRAMARERLGPLWWRSRTIEAMPLRYHQHWTEEETDAALRLDARLNDVRRRLPARSRRDRRRRTGTRIAIAVASVAAIGAGVALAGPVSDPILDDSAPARAGSVEEFDPGNQLQDPNRFRFRDDLAGDPLIASRVGDRGQNALTLRFTPDSPDLMLSQFCHSRDDNGPWLQVTLNGHDLSQEPCTAEGRANVEAASRDRYARVADDGWAGLGVRPGRQSVLRLQVTSAEGRPVLDPREVIDPVRIGVAVYELSGARVVSDGVIIKRQADVGLRYTLGGHLTAKITKSTRKLSLTVPAALRPALLLAGIPDTASQNLHRIRVTVNGTDVLAASNIGIFAFPLPAVGPQTVSIQARPDDTGVLVLAWYKLSDEPVK